MKKERLRARLYELIKKTPGITKNDLLDNVKGDFEGTNFSHVYLIIKKFIEDGIVKVDGKKKGTGHYLPDCKIPDDIPKAVTSQKTDGTRVIYEKPNAKATKRFVLEKSESNIWRTVDEDDIVEPINNLFNQCVRLVPLHYRVRDIETGEILNEQRATCDTVKNHAEAAA